jgi:hypothetical protein
MKDNRSKEGRKGRREERKHIDAWTVLMQRNKQLNSRGPDSIHVSIPTVYKEQLCDAACRHTDPYHYPLNKTLSACELCLPKRSRALAAERDTSTF